MKTKTAVLAGGCFWGEAAWEAGARPCQSVYELAKRTDDTVYSFCKE